MNAIQLMRQNYVPAVIKYTKFPDKCHRMRLSDKLSSSALVLTEAEAEKMVIFYDSGFFA